MAAKKPKLKAKRAAPKAKRKATKAASSVKSAKSAKPAPRAKAKATTTTTAKPKRKPAAKPTKKRAQSVALSPPSPVAPLEPALDMDAATADAPEEAKKGPLARLAGAVSNLFARKTAPADDTAARNNQTIELATDDIMASSLEPPPVPKPKP